MIGKFVSYMMKEENHETKVQKGQSNDDTLVALIFSEHLIEEWVEIREAAHENRNSYQTAQGIRSLSNQLKSVKLFLEVIH